MVSETITLILTGFMFLLFVIWIFWMIYWMLGKFGLWKFSTYRRLKRRYKNREFDDEEMKWAIDKIGKKWKYKDVRRFVKYEPNGSELLYTFMVLSKLKPEELESYKEVENGGQTNTSFKGEVEQTFTEENSKGN